MRLGPYKFTFGAFSFPVVFGVDFVCANFAFGESVNNVVQAIREFRNCL